VLIALVVLAWTAATTAPPKTARLETSLAACQMVTHEEVQRAFRRPFSKGSEELTACEYAALDQQLVAIKMQHTAAKLDVDREMLTLRKAYPEARMRDAAGFAHPAFFLDFPGIGTQLFVIRGEHDFLLVSVMGLGDAKKVSAPAREIARRALSRLPSVR
jgi:hypothetical protein